MTANSQQQNIAVVPDSGTGQLTGLPGKITITIAARKHSYDFEYTLPGESWVFGKYPITYISDLVGIYVQERVASPRPDQQRRRLHG